MAWKSKLMYFLFAARSRYAISLRLFAVSEYKLRFPRAVTLLFAVGPREDVSIAPQNANCVLFRTYFAH